MAIWKTAEYRKWVISVCSSFADVFDEGAIFLRFQRKTNVTDMRYIACDRSCVKRTAAKFINILYGMDNM